MLLVGASFAGKKFLCELEAIAGNLDGFSTPAVYLDKFWVSGQRHGSMNITAVGYFLERIFQYFLPVRAIFG